MCFSLPLSLSLALELRALLSGVLLPVPRLGLSLSPSLFFSYCQYLSSLVGHCVEEKERDQQQVVVLDLAGATLSFVGSYVCKALGQRKNANSKILQQEGSQLE